MKEKLLKDIQREYQYQLDNGISEEQAALFNNQLFIDKYHYDANTLNMLLSELSHLGYIEKWIIPVFRYKVD